MDLNFTVNNQELTKKDNNKIVNKSNNYIKIRIDFNGDEWEALNKYIILKNENGVAFQFQHSVEGVLIPSTILMGRLFTITVYGADETTKRITTNEIVIRLIESGYTKDISSIADESVDIFVEVTRRMDDLESQLDGKLNINDVDTDLNIDSSNPIANHAVTSKLNSIEDNIETKSGLQISKFSTQLANKIRRIS